MDENVSKGKTAGNYFKYNNFRKILIKKHFFETKIYKLDIF
jgi:hypothetical protein